MPGGLVEPAPAKINLALHVTGRRANGYHELHGLTVFTELADEVTAEAAPTDRLSVRGPFAAGLEPGTNNLVLRAVEAFRAEWPGRVGTGVALTLDKRLPVASGIGGGSADAAAAFRIMSRLSDEPVDPARLMAVAARLGADVPMCVLSRACEIRGVGDDVRPLPEAPAGHLVLVNPLIALPTAAVFSRLEGRENPPLPPLPDRIGRAAALAEWLADTRNDLEPAAMAIAPVIGDLKRAVAGTQGCLLARMSGSGATVFGLYGAAAEAAQAARDLGKAFPDFWVKATPLLRHGTG